MKTIYIVCYGIIGTTTRNYEYCSSYKKAATVLNQILEDDKGTNLKAERKYRENTLASYRYFIESCQCWAFVEINKEKLR